MSMLITTTTFTACVDYRAVGHGDDDGIVTNNTCLTPAKIRNMGAYVSATKSLRKAEEVVILLWIMSIFENTNNAKSKKTQSDTNNSWAFITPGKSTRNLVAILFFV
uniref:Uncharacterized protein n=1 Tax=Glossina pallidipes TaxID=7398 RepID=A0A1A9ZUQ6_GLOPL